MEEVLVRLVEAPTTLGNEEPGQDVMRDAFRALGLDPVDVPLDAEMLRSHPAASPFSWDVSEKRNVIADWHPGGEGGRSLILNGHIDVVAPAAASLWRTAPFSAVRDGDWLYGRGAGDMKCGLAIILGAVKALRDSISRRSLRCSCSRSLRRNALATARSSAPSAACRRTAV